MSLYHSNPKVTWSGIDLSDFIRDFRFTLDEPKRVADNPHAPGTPEHKDWETVNVHLPRSHELAERDAREANRRRALGTKGRAR